MITDITEHREFQNSLKPGDIIYFYYILFNENRYYKFIRFEKCNIKYDKRCENCLGSYIVKNLTSNEIYDLDGCRTFEKMEEFISEEEFSI